MKTAKGMGIALVVAGLLLGTACGKEAPKRSAATAKPGAPAAFTGDPEGPWCRITITREALQIRTNMRNEPGSAVQIKNESDYASSYLKKGEPVAPLEIKAAFHTYADWYLKTLTSVFAKYGFNEARFDKEASAAEKKVVNADPPANVQKAFETITRYEHQVCAVGDTPAADVKFTGSSTSAYCVEVQKNDAANEKFFKSDFSKATEKAYFTAGVASREAEDRAAAADDSMPSSVRNAIHKSAVNVRTAVLPALVKYGYDFPHLIEAGTTEERRAFTETGPAQRDFSALLSAYNDQVCTKK